MINSLIFHNKIAINFKFDKSLSLSSCKFPYNQKKKILKVKIKTFNVISRTKATKNLNNSSKIHKNNFTAKIKM